MKRSLLVMASAAGLFCLAGPAARADQITTPVAWSYNFTPSQSFISADSPGTGTVTFTNEPSKNAQGNSDVVVTDLKVSSTAPATAADTLTGKVWTVALQLNDGPVDSNGNLLNPNTAHTTMTFTGTLGGSFSALNSNVTNTFGGQQTQTWTAPSGNVYTVTLNGFTPPGPPTASNAGSISAYVQVTPAGGNNNGGHTSGTPEPSTLVLSGLGLGFAGLVGWRQRRRSLAALLA